MKKVRPYLAKLIRLNVAYVVGAVLLVLLTMIVIRFGLGRIQEMESNNKALASEVAELRTKFELLNSVVPSSEQLDRDIKLLNSLIPDSEDYFSIIYALETISQKTGFLVTSYTVNVKSSNKEKLDLTVTGIGDTESFLDFLGNYNFSGGRLITSDKIELNPQESTAIKVNLTFYNKKIDFNYAKGLQINPDTISKIAQLREKVDYSIKEITATGSGLVDFSYPKKSNPF